MNTKYQMWLSHDARREKLWFPVAPESVTVRRGNVNQSVQIAGLGEITVKQGRPADTVQFESVFPAQWFAGAHVKRSRFKPPQTLVSQILKWKDSPKPSRFLITGSGIKMYCTIEDFTCTVKGGDVGSVYFSIELKEYRRVTVRKVKKPGKKNRSDDRVQPKTYTVVKGDSLWKIAAAYLGDGGRYAEIFNLNRGQIQNPNLIYPGQVLQLPESDGMEG